MRNQVESTDGSPPVTKGSLNQPVSETSGKDAASERPQTDPCQNGVTAEDDPPAGQDTKQATGDEAERCCETCAHLAEPRPDRCMLCRHGPHGDPRQLDGWAQAAPHRCYDCADFDSIDQEEGRCTKYKHAVGAGDGCNDFRPVGNERTTRYRPAGRLSADPRQPSQIGDRARLLDHLALALEASDLCRDAEALSELTQLRLIVDGYAGASWRAVLAELFERAAAQTTQAERVSGREACAGCHHCAIESRPEPPFEAWICLLKARAVDPAGVCHLHQKTLRTRRHEPCDRCRRQHAALRALKVRVDAALTDFDQEDRPHD